MLHQHTCDRFLMPITKQIASRMLDFPLPFNPVIALKPGSKFDSVTLCAYDLKPSIETSLMYIPRLSVGYAHNNAMFFCSKSFSADPRLRVAAVLHAALRA